MILAKVKPVNSIRLSRKESLGFLNAGGASQPHAKIFTTYLFLLLRIHILISPTTELHTFSYYRPLQQNKNAT